LRSLPDTRFSVCNGLLWLGRSVCTSLQVLLYERVLVAKNPFRTTETICGLIRNG